jgi:hypothetical protein
MTNTEDSTTTSLLLPTYLLQETTNRAIQIKEYVEKGGVGEGGQEVYRGERHSKIKKKKNNIIIYFLLYFLFEGAFQSLGGENSYSAHLSLAS